MGLVWTPNSSAPACWAIGWGEGADQPLFGVAISVRPGSERASGRCRRLHAAAAAAVVVVSDRDQDFERN